MAHATVSLFVVPTGSKKFGHSPSLVFRPLLLPLMSCPKGGREGAATDRKSECGRQFKRERELEEVGKNEFVLRINPGNKSQLSVSFAGTYIQYQVPRLYQLIGIWIDSNFRQDLMTCAHAQNFAYAYHYQKPSM